MKGAGLCVCILLLSPCVEAGPTGAGDSHAARATGFPGAYLASVSLSMAADPLYASRLLDAVALHLRSVAAMTAQRAVSDYLEDAAGSSVLGRDPLDASRAAALLIADALARPEQFREVLEGLQSLQHGLGRQAAAVLRGAAGPGDKALLAALRAAGEPNPRAKPVAYRLSKKLAGLFDGPETVVDPPPSARGSHPPRSD